MIDLKKKRKIPRVIPRLHRGEFLGLIRVFLLKMEMEIVWIIFMVVKQRELDNFDPRLCLFER